ncbi:WG repeat-containing protein [Belliella aquatica]|uniref:WG containing repeat-containing protein n=1 Tax=Belliella aquatica TaxID=1323734 RepID=A0ABQ1N118_9BACT|nr:WG repeat-containing protein [Belliella aquatica]MCH7406991.1 WG repeat-containing protein [Belliella aquatica]GGC50962.1 hypothetical protein GCM10010993_31880 [Belliella aquatica]
MNLIKYLTVALLVVGTMVSVSVKGQTWEVYDHNFKLQSRINFDQIKILSESVRVSTANNQLRLLSKEYKPFFNLKGETVYQYLEPWIIVSGPEGKGAFHEYGEEIFAPEYEDIQVFYTRVLAQKGKKFWLYNRMKRTTEMIGEFDSAILSQNGQVIGKNSEGYYLPISQNPYKVYKDLREINENFIISHETTGFGLINREGNYILDPIIDEMTYLEEDYFYAFDGNQYMLIKGREERADIKYTSYHKITLENNMMLEYIHGKLRRVMKNDGILLDMVGMEKVNQVGKNHYNVFSRDNKVGLLGSNGWEVNLSSDLEQIFPGSDNLYPSIKYGKFGFVNKSGNWIIPSRFDEVNSFSEGLAAVKNMGKWGFINQQDQIVINPEFDAVGKFNRGFAIVKKNGKSQLINRTGEIIEGKDYDEILSLPDSYYITEKDGVFGLINAAGKEIIAPQFDEIRKEAQDIILVRKGDNYGIMDEEGNYVLPLYYKNILFDQASRLILAEDIYVAPVLKEEEKSNKRKRAD